MHDLIIVGGGPAGLATALHAARAGLDAVVLERHPDRGDKACGEGLMPSAVRALAALGVHPPGVPITGITYRQGALTAVARFRGEPGRGVRRTALHATLREAVSAVGVPVLHGVVETVEQTADGVRAGGLSARYLVGADGLHSLVRAAIQPARNLAHTAHDSAHNSAHRPARPGRARRWGQRQHFECVPWTDTVEVSWGSTAEAYVTPVGPRVVGVAVLSADRGSFPEQLAAFPQVRQRLAGAPAISAPRGAGPLRQDVRRRVSGRVLLVGDAAGYVDALTGEGIDVALACAQVLIASLRAGDPQRYEREWRRVSRTSRLITTGLLAARRAPGLSRAVVPAAAGLPWVFSAAVNHLAYAA